MKEFFSNYKLQLAIFVTCLPFLLLGISYLPEVGAVAGLGAIGGYIGAVLLLWQFALGIRFIVAYFTKDHVSVMKIHIFLGIYGLFFVFLHPILEMVSYGKIVEFLIPPGLAEEFDKHMSFGIIGMYLWIGIWISSAYLRGKMNYRPWLYIHYLTYPMMVLVFLHARDIGTAMNEYPLIEVYWFILMGIFGLLVMYRIVRFFNVGKLKYRLLHKRMMADGISLYTFQKIPVLSPLSQGGRVSGSLSVGQFFYIRISRFSEAHPFTVMKIDEKQGILEFGVKAVGKFTQAMESLPVGAQVYLDGPYGIFTREAQNSDSKILIAGGIGITPFVELVKRFSQGKTKLFYCNKKLEDALLREEFKEKLQHDYVDVVSREQLEDDMIVQGRLTKESFLEHVDMEMVREARYFICGSPAFMAGMRGMLAELGVSHEKVFVEEFGF